MEEPNWDYEHEEGLLDDEPRDARAFYKTLKIALQIQAEMAAEEMSLYGELGIRQ
tara:strand:- start:14837 stop:15001 length:165 start_codon:yes stop_codon:yes gene_type:complete